MTTWIVVLAAAATTYVVRISMVVVFHRRSLPSGFERVLSLATPAVLAAVVANALFVGNGGTIHPPPVTALLAVPAGALVVRRTGKPAHALAAGLPLALLVVALTGT
jgi:branched-subunit amino acid transport protein